MADRQEGSGSDQIEYGNFTDISFATDNPSELPGLNGFIANESIGGNAGKHHYAANAYYDGGELKYSNQRIIPGRSGTDLSFFVTYPTREQMRAKSQGAIEVIPPSLIDRISIKNQDRVVAYSQDKGVSIETRAVQHNAQMIIRFLQKGGDINLIPATPYLPDLEKIKRNLGLG